MRSASIKACEGFICVYSVDSRTSFDRVKALYNEILKIKKLQSEIAFVLVANKCDLPVAQRSISSTQGMNLAEALECPFVEASAKFNINVHSPFSGAVQEVCVDF